MRRQREALKARREERRAAQREGSDEDNDDDEDDEDDEDALEAAFLVPWESPLADRMALTALFTTSLQRLARDRGFGFATILPDVLESDLAPSTSGGNECDKEDARNDEHGREQDAASVVVSQRFLSTTSAFDQHLSDQATAPLWVAAVARNGVPLPPWPLAFSSG